MNSRRDSLRGFAAFLGTLSFGFISARGAIIRETTLEAWLRRSHPEFLENRVGLRRLGATYLASHPSENDLSRLSQLLLERGGGRVRSRLLAKIARDWATHDVTLLEGWVLARTEARLCAAMHLMDGGRF